MSRLFTHGNGEMLVGIDHNAQVHDLFYPYVGLENHINENHIHRVGIWVDGVMNWLNHSNWKLEANCTERDGKCGTTITNDYLGVKLEFDDVVYNEKSVFLRSILVHNLGSADRTIKIFFAHQFEIAETHRGDTGYYDPRCKCVIHYKGDRAFLVNAISGKKSFDEYTVGIFEIEGKEGSHIDAEDGELSKNPIEHGTVDSVIGLTLNIKASSTTKVDYWIAAGRSVKEAQELNEYVLEKGPEHLIRTTRDYWTAWSDRNDFEFADLPKKVERLFASSMLTVRSHIGNNGSIIASSDSDILNHGRGSYSYVWPRDGALTSLALNKIGATNASRRFFEFCNHVITEDGYLMHKYRPDMSLGSSWHPWIRDGKPELPIQEDETALTIYALYEYYKKTKDIEFIEKVYNSLIKNAADFMVNFRYEDTKLPYPSYDLWEEKYGISTFTCASVYGALRAAAEFAKLLGKKKSQKLYTEAAEEIKVAIMEHLYLEEEGMFAKQVVFDGENKIHDKTIDMSSFYGIFKFGVLDVFDPIMQKSVATIEDKLCVKSGVSGVPRYVNDMYFRSKQSNPPNPWFITTLWLSQFYIAEAKTKDDLKIVKESFNWVSKYALSTGILSEQINPQTGEQLSAAPLTWSHAEFIVTVAEYLEKLKSIK